MYRNISPGWVPRSFGKWKWNVKGTCHFDIWQDIIDSTLLLQQAISNKWEWRNSHLNHDLIRNCFMKLACTTSTPPFFFYYSNFHNWFLTIIWHKGWEPYILLLRVPTNKALILIATTLAHKNSTPNAQLCRHRYLPSGLIHMK